MKTRNNSLDAIRGVAIVLVMIGHIFVHNHCEDGYVYDFIKAVQMPLFMIVSGYLAGCGRKVSNFKEYRTLLGKRAVSYLLPFFSWLTVKHLTELPEAYHRIFFELDFGLWFLAVLFLLTFYVATAQLAKSLAVRSSSIRQTEESSRERGIQKNHSTYKKSGIILPELVFWAVCTAFVLLLLVQCVLGSSFLSPSLVLLYVPFYMLGYVTGDYGKRILCFGSGEKGKLDCRKNKAVQALAVLCMAGFLYLIAVRDLNSMNTKMDIMLQMTASLLGSLAVIDLVLLWREDKIKKIFELLGTYTLEIYVIHYHFATILNWNDRQYEFYTVQGFLFVAASFVSMSVVTFVCIWLMKKVWVLDYLFFGKRGHLERFRPKEK